MSRPRINGNCKGDKHLGARNKNWFLNFYACVAFIKRVAIAWGNGQKVKLIELLDYCHTLTGSGFTFPAKVCNLFTKMDEVVLLNYVVGDRVVQNVPRRNS